MKPGARKIIFVILAAFLLSETGFLSVSGNDQISACTTSEAADNGMEITADAGTETEFLFDPLKKDAEAAALDEADFASRRLVLVTQDSSVVDESEQVIARYDDLYILRYETAVQSMNAYVYYQDKAEAVEPDQTLEAADEEIQGNGQADIEVTEAENPLSILSETASDTVGLQTETDRQEPVIALLDTGAGLSENVISQVSLIGDELISPNLQHGENVADAIISQNADARILSIRVLDGEGRGTVSSIAAGIEYAIAQNADYINLSLYAKNTLTTSVVAEEIRKAVNEGIVVTGAAGNSSDNAAGYIPGAVEEAYIIGAADENGNTLAGSNYGDTVDYFVTADSTSEATALFTGYISKYGIGALPSDGFIYANGNETGPGLTHDTAPEEILEKLNPDYITYDENTVGYGPVACMAVKKTYIRPEYATTLAEFFGDADNCPGFLINAATEINLYDVNNDSAYVAGVLNPDEEDVRDILFARRNDNAEMLEDLHYDQETGLVYVKKIDLAAYDEETNLLTRNDVQAQLMIASESEIIDELIDAGAIQPLEDELFQAAAIQPDEEVTPESVLPEIEGEIRPGDTLHFRATRTNTYLTNQTVNYIWNPGEGAGNDVYFYEALRDGNIASAQAYWNSSTRHAQYTGDRQWRPTYASYSFSLESGNISGISGNSAMADWFRSILGSGRSLDLDCAHIGEASRGYNNVPFTITCIETGTDQKGEGYAVLAFLADQGSGGNQTLAAIYMVGYEPFFPDIEENPRITIRKVDENGGAVRGAQFTVYGWGGSSYNITAATGVTNSDGMIVFNLSKSSTGNGLFLVRETGIPAGYEEGDTFLNEADKADFEQYGGRLFYITKYGGDCVAYRDTDAITILRETGSARLVFDHDGYFVSDVWNRGIQSNVRTAWWNSAMGSARNWYDDVRMSTGWYRSAADSSDYMVYGPLTYTLTNLYAHTYAGSTGLAGIGPHSAGGSFYGGNGGADWSYTLPDGRVTWQIFNYRRDGNSYMFRVFNNTSSTLNISMPTWTNDGNQSDIRWIGGSIAAGRYMDWIASEDAFDNLARLITHIYINNAMAGSVDVHTQEYEDGIFVNRTAAGYEASATVTKTDTGGARLSGAAFAVDEWTGSGDNWTNVATGQTDTNGQITFTELTRTATNQGYFRIRETAAPAGYIRSDAVKYIHITADGQSFTTGTASRTGTTPAPLTWENMPDREIRPVPGSEIRFLKTWNGDNTDTVPSPAGTQFTVTYYEGLYDTEEELPGEPARQWVFEAKDFGDGNTGFRLTEDFFLADMSDDLYYTADDTVVMPPGTYLFRETKAAPGYELAGEVHDENGSVIAASDDPKEGPSVIRQITQDKDSGDAVLSGGAEYTFLDTPVNGEIRIVKYDSDGSTPLEGVSFRLCDSDGNEVTAAVTDANGVVEFTELYPDVYTLVETVAPEGYVLLSEAVTIRLPMTLSGEEAADRNLDAEANGVIFVPETADVNGNVTEAHYLILNQTYEITNSPSFTMPQSGANGVWPYGTVGKGLAAIAAGCLAAGPKRRAKVLPQSLKFSR